jgi:hypothetical protein
VTAADRCEAVILRSLPARIIRRGTKAAMAILLLGGLLGAVESADAQLPQLSFDQEHSIVSITVERMPGFRCDIYCYEDGRGHAVEHRKDGPSLVLEHRDAKTPGARLTTVFTPRPDGVEQVVTVEGPDAASVRSVDIVNPCIQFASAPAFGPDPEKKLGYVEDFVARCFVFLDQGLTRLDRTARVPGTLHESDAVNAPRVNCEHPWIQEYYPVWEKHPGQQKGQRGFSTDRPILPIIGVVSRDGAWLAASAWPETFRLGQVWMHCIHPRPSVLTAYDPAANRTVSRGKLYLMANDAAALRAAFERDFPDWKAVAERSAPAAPR